jgi:hypothetical protein
MTESASEAKTPRRLPKPPTPAVVEEKPAPKNTKRFVSEGRTYQVEVGYDENGREVVAKSVYREVQLPNSKRTTQILVAARGTRLQ